MEKKDEISEALYTRLRSLRAQTARLYRLTGVHKQGTSLRPVVSVPCSSNDHLKKTLANVKIEGTNIETNAQVAREILEKTEVDYDESIIYLDAKSLYNNVTLN